MEAVRRFNSRRRSPSIRALRDAGPPIRWLIAGGVAVSKSAGAQEAKGLAGTWKLDVAASMFSPGPAPKSQTITYTPSGDTMKIVVDLVAATMTIKTDPLPTPARP